MNKAIVIAALTTLCSAGWADVKVKDYTFPEKKVIDGKTLYLNGAGVRTVTYYGIDVDVYVAGLYLENNSTDPDELRKDDGLKHFHSIFLRKVSKRKQWGPWKDSIRDNCYSNCDESKEKVREFNLLLEATKSGGYFDITFYPDRIEFKMDGRNKSSGTIKSEHFSKDLFNVWLGSRPAYGPLKKNFLRGKAESLKAEESDQDKDKDKDKADPPKDDKKP